MNDARFAHDMRWGVGTVLNGAPINDPGTGKESAKQRVITAIGRDVVVVRDRNLNPDGTYGEWVTERFGTFDHRAWTVHRLVPPVEDVEALRGVLNRADIDYSAREFSADAGRADQEPGDWFTFIARAAIAAGYRKEIP